MENWLRSGSVKRKERDYTLHLGSANSSEAVCEDINISDSSAIKEISSPVQRKNTFVNMRRVIWNMDLLGVAMRVNQNLGALFVTKTAGRQTQRSYFKTESREEYFRLLIFLLFVDYFISQLKDRFLNHKEILKSIQTSLSKNIVRVSDEDLETAVQAVVNQWPNDVDASPESFFNELKMWRRNFLDQKNLHLIPTVFISSLNRCNEIIFPRTRKALKLFCTLPVTTATPERSFSTLRYLKTYLSSTMGADRLNGLALMYLGDISDDDDDDCDFSYDDEMEGITELEDSD
ncbi:hypothetical protein ANN_06840 [Periplaneta americana]|uniref:HAT C-terminal dimerisation domain-containing protein n=1 Tax=Periplaneta americana TaxID=6978 RepID=A0ABQ8TFZ1_PERAM|nr:hypothetical protein ANN_06840 [Periplaneta americana]